MADARIKTLQERFATDLAATAGWDKATLETLIDSALALAVADAKVKSAERILAEVQATLKHKQGAVSAAKGSPEAVKVLGQAQADKDAKKLAQQDLAKVEQDVAHWSDVLLKRAQALATAQANWDTNSFGVAPELLALVEQAVADLLAVMDVQDLNADMDAWQTALKMLTDKLEQLTTVYQGLDQHLSVVKEKRQKRDQAIAEAEAAGDTAKVAALKADKAKLDKERAEVEASMAIVEGQRDQIIDQIEDAAKQAEDHRTNQTAKAAAVAEALKAKYHLPTAESGGVLDKLVNDIEAKKPALSNSIETAKNKVQEALNIRFEIKTRHGLDDKNGDEGGETPWGLIVVVGIGLLLLTGGGRR